MTPLRLLILGLLVYLLFRLIRGPKQVADSRTLKHDTLMEDPVCRVYVPRSQAVAWEHHGKIHYFCSQKCREAFCRKEETSS